MLNIISTCQDILCVDINVDKRYVDHSTSLHALINNSRTAYPTKSVTELWPLNLPVKEQIGLFYQHISSYKFYTSFEMM